MRRRRIDSGFSVGVMASVVWCASGITGCVAQTTDAGVPPPEIDTTSGLLLAEAGREFQDPARFDEALENIERMVFGEGMPGTLIEAHRPDLIVFLIDLRSALGKGDGADVAAERFPVRFVVELSRDAAPATINAKSLYVGEGEMAGDPSAYMFRGFAQWLTSEMAGYMGR